MEQRTIEKNRMQDKLFIVVRTASDIQEPWERVVERRLCKIVSVTGSDLVDGAESSLLIPLHVKRRGPYWVGVGHHNPKRLW